MRNTLIIRDVLGMCYPLTTHHRPPPHRAKLKNGENGVCRKCDEEVFNHVCNCVKMRDLACEKFGRKCCKIF